MADNVSEDSTSEYTPIREDPTSERTQRIVLAGGFMLVLGGCLSGLIGAPFFFQQGAARTIVPLDNAPTPAVGVAHTIGCLEGVFLIATGASWHLLRLDNVNRWIAVGLLFGHSYGNWLGTVVAAITQASGNQYDPSFMCSMLSHSIVANNVVAFLLNSSLLVLPLMPLLMFGALATKTAPQAPIRWITIIGIVFFSIFFVVQTVAGYPDVNDNNLARANENVKDLSGGFTRRRSWLRDSTPTAESTTEVVVASPHGGPVNGSVVPNHCRGKVD